MLKGNKIIEQFLYCCKTKIPCGRHFCLHRGHSGLSLHQLIRQSQQNRWPQGAQLGSVIFVRHKMHFLEDSGIYGSCFLSDKFIWVSCDSFGIPSIELCSECCRKAGDKLIIESPVPFFSYIQDLSADLKTGYHFSMFWVNSI